MWVTMINTFGIKGTAQTCLGSREHELKHFRDQVALLMGNKGSNQKRLRIMRTCTPWKWLISSFKVQGHGFVSVSIKIEFVVKFKLDHILLTLI